MKSILLLLGCLSFLSGALLGAEPDFSKAFPKEKLFGHNSFGEGTVGCTSSYTYLTDLDFEKLEKQLIKFLGDDWEKGEQIDLLEENKELAAMLEKQGMKLKGMASLTQKEGKPGTVILQLMEMKTKIEGKKAMLSLTVVGFAEPEEEDQKKEEPAPKEEAKKKRPTGGVLKNSGR